jgi:aryl-alcohol dehydrogenase-like predicted oxidoreductase
VPGGAAVEPARAGGARAYLDKGGAAVLGVLDQVAAAHQATVAAVALAWLRARPRVIAPSPAPGPRSSSNRSCRQPRWN